MQTISFKNHTPTMVRTQKTKNQFSVCRRDWMKCQKIWVAVREWESTLPGQAQERIAQLVAEEWAKVDGRGIAVNKQNLFRYLKNRIVQHVTS